MLELCPNNVPSLPGLLAAPGTQDQGAPALRMEEACLHLCRRDAKRRTTPRCSFWRCRAGFSYVGVLLAVAIAGLTLTAANRYWSTLVQREREAELLYRGDQIRAAIQSYYDNPPGNQPKSYPRAIKDLVKDPRFPGLKRHLRKAYRDPMNPGAEWGVVRDAKGGLKGVFSQNTGQPIKQGNFPRNYSGFESAKSYKDWKFVYNPRN